MFEFQTVSEIPMFECVPLASKWLAKGVFGFVLTLPHLASLNKLRAISYEVCRSKSVQNPNTNVKISDTFLPTYLK